MVGWWEIACSRPVFISISAASCFIILRGVLNGCTKAMKFGNIVPGFGARDLKVHMSLLMPAARDVSWTNRLNKASHMTGRIEVSHVTLKAFPNNMRKEL